MTRRAPRWPSGASLVSGLCTDSLVAKPKEPEPPEPLWPADADYREPVQLEFNFML
jgi:hypothetical protein